MVYDVEGNGQVSAEQASPVDETRTVVEEEALSLIVSESAFAQADGGTGDVQSDVAGIIGQR